MTINTVNTNNDRMLISMKVIRSSPHPDGWKNGHNRAYLFGDCACNKTLFETIVRLATAKTYYDVIFRYQNLVVVGVIPISRKAFFALSNGMRVVIERGMPGDRLCFVRECASNDTTMFCMDKSCHLVKSDKSAC